MWLSFRLLSPKKSLIDGSRGRPRFPAARALPIAPGMLAGVAAVFLASCVGSIGDSDSETAPAPSGSGGEIGAKPGQPGTGNVPAPGPGNVPAGPVVWPAALPNRPAPIRLLSPQELANTFDAVLGFRPPGLGRLPQPVKAHLFDRVVQDQTVSLAHVEAFTAMADEVADWLTPEKLGSLVRACATTQPLGTDGTMLAKSRRACVEKLIDEVGRRAFRGPVDPAKATAWLTQYDAAGTYAEGLRQVVHGLFEAPEFLYVIEMGRPVSGKPGVVALTDEEIATRLSLLLCETIPDAGLLAAAQAGALTQPDQIAAAAARLMDQSCAQRTVGRFFAHWFRADNVLTAVRSSKQFPLFTEEARLGIVKDQEELTKHILWTAKGRLADFFTANFAFVSRSTAPIYDLMDLKVASGQSVKVDLPPHRRGILSRPLFLVATTGSDFTSPIVRGVTVLEKFLGQHLPAPPDNIPTKPDDGTTQPRAQVEQHASDPACSGCHRLIDPVGFALEDFDAIGRYRTTDRGKPVNAAGGIPSLGIDNGTIKGAAELSVAVAGLKELRECFATQWFRFGMARLESSQDAEALRDLADLQSKNGVSLKDAMVGLVRTHAFRHRSVSR